MNYHKLKHLFEQAFPTTHKALFDLATTIVDPVCYGHKRIPFNKDTQEVRFVNFESSQWIRKLTKSEIYKHFLGIEDLYYTSSLQEQTRFAGRAISLCIFDFDNKNGESTEQMLEEIQVVQKALGFKTIVQVSSGGNGRHIPACFVLPGESCTWMIRNIREELIKLIKNKYPNRKPTLDYPKGINQLARFPRVNNDQEAQELLSTLNPIQAKLTLARLQKLTQKLNKDKGKSITLSCPPPPSSGCGQQGTEGGSKEQVKSCVPLMPCTFKRTLSFIINSRQQNQYITSEKCWEMYTKAGLAIGKSDHKVWNRQWSYANKLVPKSWFSRKQAEDLFNKHYTCQEDLVYYDSGKKRYLSKETVIVGLKLITNALLKTNKQGKQFTVARNQAVAVGINIKEWLPLRVLLNKWDLVTALSNSYFVGGKVHGIAKKYALAEAHPLYYQFLKKLKETDHQIIKLAA